ncbi:MAG: hypothetical protein GYA55_08340 [SAR324 cluster bacterium]|uniref:Uncharacterized protein n=1 Tax=SAR324 cluster bacterium TaxID=2024889 RepID=A0A7X9IKI6_9DELT|nr:hypothetical protein [SAR324 cluster bacterium]
MPKIKESRSLFESLINSPISIVLVLLLCGILWFYSKKRENITFDSSHRSITLSINNNNYLNYKIHENGRISGRVINADIKKLSLSEGGISAFVFYLTDSDYQDFEKNYLATSKCPASFLNSNSQALALVPASQDELEQIKKLDLKEGDKITFEGQYLVYEYGKIHGLDLRYDPGKIRPFHLIKPYIDKSTRNLHYTKTKFSFF